MYRLRTTKTSSGAVAVQVVEYKNNCRKILLHVGSSKDYSEVELLKQTGLKWIEENNPQPFLFSLVSDAAHSSTISLDKLEYRGFSYRLLYETLSSIMTIFKYHLIPESLILNDLVITRIAKPCSKSESFEFMRDYFDVDHSRRDFYRALNKFSAWKEDALRRTISAARKHFGFSFSFVFYDLTTLYFESFESDDLRKVGFSKDNKSSNPQIMIGLMVDDNGFPVYYQVFPGNKFEGHTLMPSLLDIKKRYKIEKMTVVADAAMISDANVEFLRKEKLDYIVAARSASLPIEVIENVAETLNQTDGATTRIVTKSKGILVFQFDHARFRKEKREMEKQLLRAEEILKTPSKVEIIKRSKFLKGKQSNYELNQKLISKTRTLLGIKGYYASRDDLSDQEIIKNYKQLWNVEKSFRISKSDLKARPIFHSKEQAIETHILICFMALAIAKYIEIKTKRSIKAVIKELSQITDAKLYNQITKQQLTIRQNQTTETQKILNSLSPH